MSRQENKSEKAIPNLYKMLGLGGPDTSSDVIGAKIERLLRKADAIAATDTKKAEQARKIAAVARKQLCDPERKEKYDALWLAQYGGRSTGGVDADKDAALSPKFSALLPHGSPSAAFDMAAFLEAQPTPRFGRKQFDQLVASVAATAESVPARDEAPSSELGDEPTASPVPSEGINLAIASTGTTQLGKQLREKRKKSLLVPILGLLGCMAIILGLIAFLLQPERPDEVVADSAARVADEQLAAQPRPPRRSGLPQVGMSAVGDSPPTVMDLQPEPAPPQSADDIDLFMPDSEQTDSLDGETTGSPMDMGESSIGGTMVTPEPEATPVESIEAVLKAVLKQAAAYDYDQAVDTIFAAREQSLSEDQATQLTRVEAVVRLAQQAHASLVAKVQSMDAGETFLVGTSAEVGFVSGDAEQIAIRLRGQPRKYTYQQLPPGLLYALLDLSLDRTNARALGARGAFVLLQPNRTDATISKAREHLVAAAGSGAFEEDLPAVIEDLAL